MSLTRNFTYIKYIWSRYKSIVIFSMVFVAAIQFLLIYFNSTLDVAPMIEFMLSQLPPQINDMFGEEILNQVSLEGTIAFGLEHPLVITLFTFISISITSSNIASGAINKDLEIILSLPFKRSELILSLYFFASFLLFVLILSVFTGALSASLLFHEIDSALLTKMILADINGWLLHMFIMSFALFFSVFFKDAAKAVRWSAIIALVSYFLNIISVLWDELAFTRYINFFSYFTPQKVMAGDGSFVTNMIILALGSILLLLGAHNLFKKKDIT